jgi:hypothetical protein
MNDSRDLGGFGERELDDNLSRFPVGKDLDRLAEHGSVACKNPLGLRSAAFAAADILRKEDAGALPGRSKDALPPVSDILAWTDLIAVRIGIPLALNRPAAALSDSGRTVPAPALNLSGQRGDNIRVEHQSLDRMSSFPERPSLSHRDKPGRNPALALGTAGQQKSWEVIKADEVSGFSGHSLFWEQMQRSRRSCA